MRHPRARLAALPVVALLLAACGDATPASEDEDAPGVEEPQPDDSPDGERGEGSPDDDTDDGDERERGEDDSADDDGEDRDERLRRREQQAVELAAEQHDTDTSAVTVVQAEAVTWSDGALGCPEEDKAYTQALVEGYRIVVEVDGEQVHYHGAWGEPPFRCEDPEPPAERE